MDHSWKDMHHSARNIVEIKNELTEYLADILSPFLFEGIRTIYLRAREMNNTLESLSIQRPNVKKMGTIKTFKLCLKKIPKLNQYQIEKEVEKIKEKSRCSDWFDDLVRAVIKSHIILLTYSENESEVVNSKYHETVDINNFIHNCYIECAREIYNYPEIFEDSTHPLVIKKKQREFCNLLKKVIRKSIKNMLPMKEILTEFLKNDYVRNKDEEIRLLVEKQLEQNNYPLSYDKNERERSVDANIGNKNIDINLGDNDKEYVFRREIREIEDKSEKSGNRHDFNNQDDSNNPDNQNGFEEIVIKGKTAFSLNNSNNSNNSDNSNHSSPGKSDTDNISEVKKQIMEDIENIDHDNSIEKYFAEYLK